MNPEEAMQLAQKMIDDMPESEEKRLLQQEHDEIVRKRNEMNARLEEMVNGYHPG